MQQDSRGPAYDLTGASGPRAARPESDALAILEDWLSPTAGQRLLDIGCGKGGLAQALVKRGVRVTGVDPVSDAVDAARRAVPQAEFLEAGGEALPFPDHSFDGAIFLNSLHHVPVEAMSQALAEALRVSGGPVLVIEPLPEGPFFEAMRPVEDETELRLAAQAAIGRCIEQGKAVVARRAEYDDVRHFPDAAAFLDKIVAVDPTRAEAARRFRPEVERLVARWAAPEPQGLRLAQPHRALLLLPVP